MTLEPIVDPILNPDPGVPEGPRDILPEGDPSSVIISPIFNGSVTNAYILPVIAEPIRIGFPQGNRRDIIINVGEAVSFEHRKPNMISINSFFPETDDTYVDKLSLNPDGSITPPQHWVKRMRAFENRVLQITILNTGITGKYIIDDFHITYQGGVGKEIGYSVRFVQHQVIRIRALGETGVLGVRERFPEFEIANEYLVKGDDSLIKIARKTGVPVQELINRNAISNLDEDLTNQILHLRRTREVARSGFTTDEGTRRPL